MLSTNNVLPVKELICFELMVSVCQTDGAQGATVYGLRGMTSDGGDGLIISDVACNKETVEALLFRLQGERIAPEQLRYIVEDYIAGI